MNKSSRKAPGLYKAMMPIALGYSLVLSPMLQAELPAEEPPQIITGGISSIDNLQQALEQKDFANAYQLATSLLLKHEGDEQFDFMFAMSALESGHYDQALFALERLTSSHPDNPRYQLELARTLYFSGNLTAARHEFNQVLTQNPPQQVQRNIQLFLNKLDRAEKSFQPGLNFYAELASGWDSNINSATDSKTFEIPNQFTVTLDDNSRELDSAFVGGQLHGQYQQPLSKHTAITVQAGINAKHNFEVSEFDLDVASLTTGIHQHLGRHQLKANLSYQQIWLGGDSYQSQFGLNGEWRYLAQAQWQYSANLFAASNDNKTNENLETQPVVLTLGMQIPTGRLRHNISVYLGIDEEKHSQGKEYGKDYFGANYKNIFYMTPSQQLYASGTLHQAEYHASSSLTGQTRSDLAAHLLAGWQLQLNQQLLLKTALGFSNNNSNIDIYDYQRAKLEVGLGYRF